MHFLSLHSSQAVNKLNDKEYALRHGLKYYFFFMAVAIIIIILTVDNQHKANPLNWIQT